jgi:hypothetical protein
MVLSHQYFVDKKIQAVLALDIILEAEGGQRK